MKIKYIKIVKAQSLMYLYSTIANGLILLLKRALLLQTNTWCAFMGVTSQAKHKHLLISEYNVRQQDQDALKSLLPDLFKRMYR